MPRKADCAAAHAYHNAVPLLEPFLTRAPGAQVYRNLGFALTRAGRKAEGVDLLKKAISLEPDEWWTYYALGYAYFYEAEFREAAPWFEKVLELRPRFPEIEDRLRQIRAGQGPRSKPKP
jgi:tetratricopeptide (TPR) repeat protein